MKTVKLSFAIAALCVIMGTVNANGIKLPQAKQTTKVSFKDAALNGAWQSYDQLDKSIFAADVKQSKASAVALTAALTNVKNNTKALAESKAIAAATDADGQRKHFAALSAALTPLFKASGTATGEVYVAHCPMYNDGSDWLTATKEVKNPYYGNKMPACGSITETIK
jgi:hypothetical protein